MNLKETAKYLFEMHPAPWSILERGIDGYVCDANDKFIFGGERYEGYVGRGNKEIVALVDLVNSVYEHTKGDS